MNAAKADLVGGLIPTSQIPALALNTIVTVASRTAMLALTTAQVQPGDVAVDTSTGATRGSYMLLGADPSQFSSWVLLNAPTDAVSTVNGQSGTVVLGASDVGAEPTGTAAALAATLVTVVDNGDGTATISGPSIVDNGDGTATFSATGKTIYLKTQSDTLLAAKATLASPAFTGTPTVPTQTAGDSSTKVASTAFVAAAVAAGGGSSGPTTQRVSTQEAQGGGTASITINGLAGNWMGTATSRALASTSMFTRLRRVGFVSATTSNARAGIVGNGQFYGTDGYTLRWVFGIASYNAAHGYAVGMAVSDDMTVTPGTQTNVLHLFANPGDTNWKLQGGPTGGMGSVIDLGSGFPINTSNTDLYDVTFTVPAGGTVLNYTVTRLNTGGTVSGTYSTLPSPTQVLQYKMVGYVYASAVASQIDFARVVATTTN